MSEPRFTIQKASGVYLHLPIFDNGVEMADGDVCILLNEQQATIKQLEDTNDNFRIKLIEDIEVMEQAEKKIGEQQATIEHLTKSRDKWSKSAKLHSEYFNCLEKAIEIAYEEKPYPKIEDIMNIYSKLEKEIDDE